MKKKLDKNLFYSLLKQYKNKYIPIFIQMPININSHIKISLSEERLSGGNITHNYNLQIYDSTISGYQKYKCKDIEFNLIQENIFSDYQLYKFINKKIQEVLGGTEDENRNTNNVQVEKEQSADINK